MADTILTPTELAARLRVSERTVYRLIEQGCPSMLVGKRRRFDWSAVQQWTQQQGEQCRSVETMKAGGTSRSVSVGNAFTAACQRVHLRVMPKP